MASDLQTLGGLAGLGKGLAAGAQMTLNHSLAIREQNMKLRISSAQIGLGLKQLSQQIREKDAQNERFYDGLKHEDLMKTKDNRARRRLQRMVSSAALERQSRDQTFGHEEAILMGERNIELTNIRGETSRSVARTQVAPRHRANELVERGQDFAIVPKLMQKGTQFITDNVSDDNGRIDIGTMAAKAKALGFVDEKGEGNVMEYAGQLYAEFTSSNTHEFGEDAPQISFSDFHAMIFGVVKGDAIAKKQVVDSMALKVVEQHLVLPAQQGANLIQHSMSGQAKVPMALTAKGDLELTGSRSKDIKDVVTHMGKALKTVEAGTLSIESWYTSFKSKLETEAGLRLETTPKGASNMTDYDRGMLQLYFEDVTGRPAPFAFSNLNENTLTHARTMIGNSSNLMSPNLSDVGDVPAGTSVTDVRGAGSFQSKVAGSQAGSRERFSSAMNDGDSSAMANEMQNAREEYAGLIQTLEAMPPVTRNKATMAHLESYRVLLDHMSMTFQKFRSGDRERKAARLNQLIMEETPNMSVEETAAARAGVQQLVGEGE